MSQSSPLESVLEALLLASQEPLTVAQMISLFEVQPSKQEVEAAIVALQKSTEGRGLELQQVASGWRYQIRESYSSWVARLFELKPRRYSKALMESLACIVYRQPISRGEIEQVRGVSLSSHIVRTLLDRGWIHPVGHKETPGKPVLYGTTQTFLDDFGLTHLDELPELPAEELLIEALT